MTKHLSLFLTLLTPSLLAAQTNITDNISTDTVWDVADSPYVILNTIAVDQNVALTIDAGVTVKFEAGVNLDVRGTILVQGTEVEPIEITSNQATPGPGAWGGIIIASTSGATSLIEYAEIAFALSAVVVREAAPTIQYCTMSQTLFSAVQIESGSPIVQYNDIHSTQGASVFVATGTAIIRANLLHDNAQDGIHVLADGAPIIEHNLIYGSLRYGINSSTGCVIFNNTIDDNLTAINCDNESPTVYNNIITNHSDNGIRAVNGAAPALSYNNVWNNATDWFGISPGTGDISSDPKFANQANADYQLLSDSPCIDAGNPSSPLDPDGTVADMGALYFDQLADLIDCNLVLRPATGEGTFKYRVTVTNGAAAPLNVDVWTEISGATAYDELLFLRSKTVPAGGSVRKNGTHTIPADSTDGVYQLTASIGTYPSEPIKTCTVDYTKVSSTSQRNSVNPHESEQVATLAQNHPNPFNPATLIRYHLRQKAHVTLKIYNLVGQEVVTLVDQLQSAGYKSVIWNSKNGAGKPVSSGIYLYKLIAGDTVLIKKMSLLR